MSFIERTFVAGISSVVFYTELWLFNMNMYYESYVIG